MRENDGFDNELRNFNKEFNGGKTRLGARAAFEPVGSADGAADKCSNVPAKSETRKSFALD